MATGASLWRRPRYIWYMDRWRAVPLDAGSAQHRPSTDSILCLPLRVCIHTSLRGRQWPYGSALANRTADTVESRVQYLPIESRIHEFQDGYYAAIARCHTEGSFNTLIAFMLEKINETLSAVMQRGGKQ